MKSNMIATTIEQSKKLLELGLNPETSDMIYTMVNGRCTPFIRVETINELEEDDVLCWSLGALLEVMPPYLFEWDRGIDLNIYRNLNGKGWHVSYVPNNIYDMQKDKFRQITNGDTLIEAAYSMIVWLLENGHIK